MQSGISMAWAMHRPAASLGTATIATSITSSISNSIISNPSSYTRAHNGNSSKDRHGQPNNSNSTFTQSQRSHPSNSNNIIIDLHGHTNNSIITQSSGDSSVIIITTTTPLHSSSTNSILIEGQDPLQAVFFGLLWP